MSLNLTPSGISSVVDGLALVALGIALLWAKPRRAETTVCPCSPRTLSGEDERALYRVAGRLGIPAHDAASIHEEIEGDAPSRA